MSFIKRFLRDLVSKAEVAIRADLQHAPSSLRNNKSFGQYNLVQPGRVSYANTCPSYIPHPPYCENEDIVPDKIEIKNRDQIVNMRQSCQLAKHILQAARNYIQVGLTTDELDRYIHDLIISNGAYPSPLQFNGFPKSICTSVNNAVVHGIPDDRKLEDGDIISVDISVYLNGYHGDCAATFPVGNVDNSGQMLIQETEQILNAGIRCCGPNKPFSIIGKTIQYEAQKRKFQVIPSVTGHGIGHYFHGPPEINHSEYFEEEEIMLPGMTFTIEPAIGEGGEELELDDDCWTLTTVDGSRTAQFEHTVLITEKGVEILTK